MFIVLSMIGQSLFFGKFYIDRKIGKLQRNLEEFTRHYDTGNWSDEQINTNTNSFIENNNAQMAILDQNGMLKYMNSYEITISTSTGEEMIIPMNNIVYSDGLDKLNLKVGAKATIEGMFFNSDNRMISISSIEANDYKWENYNNKIAAGVAVSKTLAISPISTVPEAADIKFTYVPIEGMEEGIVAERAEPVNIIASKNAGMVNIKTGRVEGEIKRLDIPSQMDYLLPYRTSMLLNAVDNWFWLSKTNEIELKPNKIIRYQYTDPTNGIKNVIFVMPLFKNGNISEMLFTMSSLQPVDEAVEAMRDYYIYGFAAAFIFIILLSFIYSRMIAKPLININKVALKMSEMDFAEQLAVVSNDEIGSLSSSINTLSRNLKDKIDQLYHANQKLVQDIEKERKIEITRKEFISGVSHELKTPLSIIKSYTEGIKDGVSRDKEDYYLDVIMDESVKMEGLVRDMLDLSKLESRNTSLDIETFDIIEMVDEIRIKFHNLSTEKGIEVNFQHTVEALYVEADKRRIEQVLRNLISNALLYTQKHGYVEICLLKEDNNVKVMVENYGETIPEDKLDKIWDRFYRLDESRDRKTGGTGLGLSIVKNILQLHQSRYGVCNTENGVLFYFYLEPAME
jgi:signal transduction histidine kinase